MNLNAYLRDFPHFRGVEIQGQHSYIYVYMRICVIFRVFEKDRHMSKTGCIYLNAHLCFPPRFWQESRHHVQDRMPWHSYEPDCVSMLFPAFKFVLNVYLCVFPRFFPRRKRNTTWRTGCATAISKITLPTGPSPRRASNRGSFADDPRTSEWNILVSAARQRPRLGLKNM